MGGGGSVVVADGSTAMSTGRRRWLAPAVIAAVLAVAVTLALLSLRGAEKRGASGPPPPWRTHTFSGLTLQYPAGWHAVLPDFNALGGTPLGYLVNRKPAP